MRSVRLLLALVFIFSLQPGVFAQEKAGQNKIKTIFSYKKELGLTEKQVADMTSILGVFQKYLTDKGEELRQLRLKFNGLVKQKADLKLIKEIIAQISAAQADISYTDIETSRKVEGVLTPAQLKKWNGMQEAYRKEEAQARQLKQ